MATQNFSAEVVRTIGGMGGVPPMQSLGGGSGGAITRVENVQYARPRVRALMNKA